MMSSGNFTYPPWSSLNFTRNCTITAQFLASWFQSADVNINYQPKINLVHSYFGAALPPSSQPITYGQTVDWYYASLFDSSDHVDVDPQFMKNVIANPLEKCKSEFCTTLGNPGNPDIGGIGVSDTFF